MGAPGFSTLSATMTAGDLGTQQFSSASSFGRLDGISSNGGGNGSKASSATGGGGGGGGGPSPPPRLRLY